MTMESLTSTQMAQRYGLKSSVAFNKLMCQCGILVDTSKGYVLATHLRDQGLVTAVTAWFFLPSGIKASKKRAAWTQKGQQLIHAHLMRLGIVPLDEQRDLFS